MIVDNPSISSISRHVRLTTEPSIVVALRRLFLRSRQFLNDRTVMDFNRTKRMLRTPPSGAASPERTPITNVVQFPARADPQPPRKRAELVPFPLAHRHSLVHGLAIQMAAREVGDAEAYLKDQIQRWYADALQDQVLCSYSFKLRSFVAPTGAPTSEAAIHRRVDLAAAVARAEFAAARHRRAR
jgi:hypothetical protein